MKLGVENFFFKIPISRTILIFSCKTSGFAQVGALFGNFFGTFLSFFFFNPGRAREARER